MTEYESPYLEALDWITSNPGTSSSIGLAKLILSLWNDQCCFSLRECTRGFDKTREELALRMIQEFIYQGETPELVKIGHEVNEFYDRLWPISQAGSRAKSAQRQAFQDEDDESYDSMDE